MSRVHEIVTENIIAMLDEGVVPWRRPWRSTGADIARNAWGKKYRGVNVWLLAFAKMKGNYQSNLWMTFNQIAKQEGSVKPGSKSTMVVFWKVGAPTKVTDPETGKTKVSRPFMLRYFNVFNLEQTTGLKLTGVQKRIEDARTVAAIDSPEHNIDEAEAIIASYFVRDGAPTFAEGGDAAAYSPIHDSIVVPAREQYESRSVPAEGGAADDVESITAPEYYSTVFHEIGHSTGHETRCNRKGVANFDHFGSEKYAQEELVAEMTAAFLCAESGIDNTLANSVAYIANWKQKLTDDKNLLVRAAGQAQKAADFVLDNGDEKEEDVAA